MKKGFTLIELLIVIGILAILATVVVVIINPTEIFRQTRDSQRLTEINTINSGISLAQSLNSGIYLGESQKVYISLPDDINPDCSSYTLPGLPGGWEYRCVTLANLRKVDGTGWIPVNFTSVAGTNILSALPVDPTNTDAGGLYYTYVKGSWELTTVFESEKYQTQYPGTKGFKLSGVIEAGASLTPIEALYRARCVPPQVYKLGSAGYSIGMAIAANNKILTPAFSVNAVNNAVRIRGWFVVNAKITAQQCLFSFAINSLSLSIPYNSNDMQVYYHDTGAVTRGVTFTNAMLNKFGAKRQIGLDVNYTAKTVSLYIDGALFQTKDISGAGAWTPKLPSEGYTKSFGLRSDEVAQIAGKVDEVGIWNTLGGANWWLADYNAGVGTYTQNSADLEVGYHFDKGSGTALDDLSSNNRDGVIGTANTWQTGLVNIPDMCF